MERIRVALNTGKGDRRPARKASLRWGAVFLLVLAAPGIAAGQAQDFAQVSTLIRAGRLDAAEKRLQTFLTGHPHSARALNLLGTVYLRQTRYSEAESSLRKAVAAAPKFADAWRNLGEACLAQDKAHEAQAAFTQVAKLVPGDSKSLLALASLYQKSGEFQQSLDAVNQIAPDQRTLSLLPVLAADYFGLNQPDKAALEVRAILQVADKNPELAPQLAEFLLERGAVGDADELLKLAARRQRPTDRFLYDTARVEELKGDRAQARKTLSEVLGRSPEFLDALLEAARMAGRDSDWSQAADLLGRADQLAPRRVSILQGLVAAQLNANRVPAALETAKKLQALQPGDSQSQYFLALALVGNRQWSDALPLVQKVLVAHPQDREANLMAAVIAYNLNNLAEAKKGVEFCLRQNPSDPSALYYQGLIQKTEGNSAEAIQSLVKSVTGNPKNVDARSALGGLYLQAGNLPQARAALEGAIELSPDDAQNHYQLAQAYARSGFADKAREELQAYQKLKARQNAYPATNEAPPPSSRPKEPL